MNEKDDNSPSPREIAERLSRMIKIPTVSRREPEEGEPALGREFQDLLVSLYPKLFRTVLRERVGDYGFLVTWPGKNPLLPPLLLVSHYDVVPAEDEGSWRYPPFSGALEEGFVWGRGAQDTKITVAFPLEAAAVLAEQGFVPERTVIFAFGGDEEVGGLKGAAAMARVLRERGQRPFLALDEGAVVTRQVVSLCRKPVALVGVEEKGRLSVHLQARGRSGHASRPPRETAAGLLAGALHRIDEKPFPSKIIPSVKNFFKVLAPEVSPPLRWVFNNPGIFGPLLKGVMTRDPNTASLVRTTAAATFIRCGIQENVLPELAEALLNIRILPGESVAGTLEYLRKVVGNPRVEISPWEGWAPSEPVAGYSRSGELFREFRKLIGEVFPEAVAAPYLIAVSTDSRHYADITDTIIRFVPIFQTGEDLTGIHGRDERISLENLERGYKFYKKLLQHFAG